MSERGKLVGKVIHFYNKISVAVVELYDTLSLGDKVLIRGRRTNLEQTVESMEIE
ncbi:TPA: translation elongation factor-like protein, partial [Candidatus Micrarchaeota archaeon]|nr:translation elongation factor-like protein [Candidatus Micrarchaeota archaeon]